jgi:hypothetical protein
VSYEKGDGSGYRAKRSAPHPGMNHVRKAGYPNPGEQPEPEMPIEERERVPRLPEVQFLKRRLPNEPKSGPWK